MPATTSIRSSEENLKLLIALRTPCTPGVAAESDIAAPEDRPYYVVGFWQPCIYSLE
jgi:hypothetical protein